MTSVLRDKPEAKSLLSVPEQELVDRANEFLLLFNTLSGLADRLDDIEALDDGAVSEALLAAVQT